jgi:predicted PurR-regulated permease PerM
MEQRTIQRWTYILLVLVLTTIILVYAKAFLVPLIFGALLSMLLLPVTKWLQRKGLPKGLAAFLTIFLLVIIFAIVIGLISWQISGIAEDASKIEKQISQRYSELRDYVAEHLGISQQKQEEVIRKQQESSTGKLSSMLTGLIAGVGSFLTDFILVLVYIFLFIYYRMRLKNFLIRIVPKEQEANAEEIVESAKTVTQKYLTGLGLMIVGLWIMYGIGFTIAGVKNSVFFAVLCGVCEIVPFVGNLFGTTVTVLMTLAQGGSLNMIIGVIITYALVQTFQSYVLEPLVVGAEVNINPVFTIIGLVAGEAIWGIAGMILAIPLLGILKIICDHIDSLKPFAYLIGQEKKKKKSLLSN